MFCITYYLVGVLVVSEGVINFIGGTDYAKNKKERCCQLF